MADFPRMSIPYKGDRYTGKSQMIYGQYVYELDRGGELFWTHTLPSTAVLQGIVPASDAAPQSGSGQPADGLPAQYNISEDYRSRFAALAKANIRRLRNLRMVRDKKKMLLAEWRRLEKEIGIKVSVDDAVNWK